MHYAQHLTRILTIACLAFCAFLGLLSLLSPDAMTSGAENRQLAQKPQFTQGALLSGEYFDQIENYLSDQLAFREHTFGWYARWQMLMGSHRIHKVVWGDGQLLPYFAYAPQKEDALLTQKAEREDASAQMQALQQLIAPWGGHSYLALLPHKRYFMQEAYPAFYERYEGKTQPYIERFMRQMQEDGIAYLDLEKNLRAASLPVFFDSEHHINQNGAQVTYRAVMERLIEDSVCQRMTTFTLQTLDNPFMGAYNRQIAGLFPTKDHIVIATPQEGFVPFTRKDAYPSTPHQEVRTTLYDPVSAKGAVNYGVYMGGDFGLSVIDTKRAHLPTLLMIGDSQTNIIEPLFVQDFNRCYYMDLRYFPKEELSEFLKEHQPDIVLVLITTPVQTMYFSLR